MTMEDTQPNEVRLAQKGSTHIPRVANHAELVQIPLPPECRRGAPGNYAARKRWIEHQKRRLRIDRHLSVLSFKCLPNSVEFTCRPPSCRSQIPPRQNRITPQTVNPDPIIIEHNYGRWSTFRSGCMDISLSNAEASMGPCSSTAAGQGKNLAVVTHSDSGNEDDAEVLLDSVPVTRGFVPVCGNLLLSLGSHDRPRRLLHDISSTYVVTAHGNIDQVSVTAAMTLDRNIRLPNLPFEEFVDDACVLSHQGEPLIILGHARERNQITFLIPGHGQVPRHISLHRDWNTTKRFGVSATTSILSPLKFASGGYDHRVHLWDIAQDLSGASSVGLAITHTSAVHSLLPAFDTSHKLLSVGADRDVHIYDMSAERVVQTLKMSCIPFHAHKTNSQSCTLIEVSHLETQFEIRDHRLPTRAVQRFGFLSEERRGRYEKADSWSHFVACGDRNGTVHLWDRRNVSTEVALRQCFNDPVVQVAKSGSRLLACSKRNELACIVFEGG